MNRNANPPAVLQSQRDCVLHPKVARNELPWVAFSIVHNPNGVVSLLARRAATPLGLIATDHVSLGSSLLATLGFGAVSPWDSPAELLIASVSNLIAAAFSTNHRQNHDQKN